MATGTPGQISTGELKCFSIPQRLILQLSSPVTKTLEATPYTPPESSPFSVKSHLQSLLPSNSAPGSNSKKERIKNLFLCLVTIASASDAIDSPTLCWITKDLTLSAMSALQQFCEAAQYGSVEEMVADLFGEIVPDLKTVIKDSCVDTENEEEMVSASLPVGYSILAAHQFRWIVSQVGYPLLGNFCWLVIPCALTALDHWSPEVKLLKFLFHTSFLIDYTLPKQKSVQDCAQLEVLIFQMDQGMVTFLHIANNVSTTALSWYEEALLDACYRNIPASEELWYRAVEVSVLLLTCTQKNNPRSPWFDRMLSEMLGHLEWQPFNKERRIAWLSLIEPVFDAMGLFLLAHFRHLFSLFFQWMHAADDETLTLVLERLNAIIRLTWIRKSPHTERLVDELVLVYKESATRKSREILCSSILQLFSLLQRCKKVQFESTWEKHTHDPDLVMLMSSFNQRHIITFL